MSVTDPCILVDESDKVVGTANKRDAHLLTNIQSGMLHRAFSVFLFSKDRKNLLIQQRAPSKATFPNMWSNTCCSHPQTNFPGETDETDAIGVKKAATRRLSFELALEDNAVPFQEMSYITRIHYYVRNLPEDNLLGEHEIDYILFTFTDLEVGKPNPDEVSKTSYISREELQMRMRARPQDFTPWFRLIADNFLFEWWNKIHDLDSIRDHQTIHNFCVLKT